MHIDVDTLSFSNFQLSNWNFNYKCSYGQSYLVLHSARVDEVIQDLWNFFHNFLFNSYNSKTISWAEI